MLFFLLGLIVLSNALEAPLHRHLTVRTSIQCETTEECLSQLSSNWCDRGVYCDVGYCHKIPHFPCEQGQVCDPLAKKCGTRKCKTWRDCDDGLFCTGIEKCIRGECVRDTRKSPDCSHGKCSEYHKKCHTPLSLVNESLRVKYHAYDMIKQSVGNGVHSQDNTSNTTAPTPAPTEPLNNTLMLTIIIAIAVVVFVVIFIIAIIGNTYKPMNALTVIDTTVPGDRELYDVETFYGNH